MEKLYLPFYYTWRDKTKNLSNEEFGKLTRAILLYSETGELTSGFSDLGEMAYEFITDVIKRSQKKSDDGRKGAYKRWNSDPYSTHIATHYNTNAINTNININRNRNKNKNKNRNTEEITKEEKRKRFLPPSLDEVRQYCIERRNNINAEQFIDFYTANGWKVGKNAMKDWKAAVRTWERNGIQNKCEREYSEAEKAETEAFIQRQLERFEEIGNGL